MKESVPSFTIITWCIDVLLVSVFLIAIKDFTDPIVATSKVNTVVPIPTPIEPVSTWLDSNLIDLSLPSGCSGAKNLYVPAVPTEGESIFVVLAL